MSPRVFTLPTSDGWLAGLIGTTLAGYGTMPGALDRG
jgi:hypothetical protein